MTSKINRNLDDLHPNDRLARLRFRAWMQDEMQRQGIGNRELGARAKKAAGWAYGITTGLNWRAASLQELVRALGFRLHFNVNLNGIQIAPRGSIALADLYAGHRDPTQRDEAARRDLGDVAKRLREAVGISSATLAARLNSGGDVVRIFEDGDRPYYLLVTAQRHFRALGAELELVIEDSEGNWFQAPAGEWEDQVDSEVCVIELGDRTLVWNAARPETVVSFTADNWKAWRAGVAG